MTSWEDFVDSAVTDKVDVNSFGTTKSFKDIETRVIYKISAARIVQTQYGDRVILTIVGDEGAEDRWCFPRLQAYFTEKHADGTCFLKPKKTWPKKLGFEHVDPYKFFVSMK